MVSVVITTYKRPVNILKRAINSILQQSYTNWELIIVNDYPSDLVLADEIREMISNYKDNRIKYILHEINRGACEARNTGIKNATGNYIAFLDDDDEWCNNKLEILLPYIKKENVGLVFSDVIYVYNGYEKMHRSKSYSKYNEDIFKALLINNYIGSTSFPLIKKDVFQKVGYFNPEMRACQDLEMWIRIANKYKIEYCPIPLTKYYFSEDCITKNILARIESHEKIISKYRNIYISDLNLLHLKYINIACDSLLTKDYNFFKIYLKKSFSVSNIHLTNYYLVLKTFLIIIRNKFKIWSRSIFWTQKR